MRHTRGHYLFHKLKEFIKSDDYTAIAHVLRWEYKKEELFDLKNDEGLTLIHIACFEGHRECLEMFLRNGASVHIQSSVGWTPLHAATLGGKLEVVEYLLRQCSANPSARDEMGCLASDLTMDAEILRTLNKYVDERRIRRELEKLAALKAEEDALLKKRNTYNFDSSVETSPSNTSVSSRTNSIHGSSTGINRLRDHRTQGSLSQENTGLLSIPNSDTNVKRQNSSPMQRTASRSSITTDKESHNQSIIEQISTCSSPGSPRVTRFSTSSSSAGTERNRDSGVFDDEIDMDSQTDQLIQKQLDQARHFKVI